MHFFSPAHMMPLVECVRGEDSSPVTIATVMGVSKRLKKVGWGLRHERKGGLFFFTFFRFFRFFRGFFVHDVNQPLVLVLRGVTEHPPNFFCYFFLAASSPLGRCAARDSDRTAVSGNDGEGSLFPETKSRLLAAVAQS